MNKRLFVIVALLSCLVMLFACGQKEYPVLEDASEGVALQEGYGESGFSAQFPAEGWILAAQPGTNMAIAMTGNEDDDFTPNVNASISQEYSGTLNESHIKGMKEAAEENAVSGLDFTDMHMRSFCGSPVIYNEQEMTIGEEHINLLIEQGTIAPEDKEAYLEVLENSSAKKLIQIYAVVDGYIVVYTGTYENDADKPEILKAMCSMIKTTTIG